MRRRVLGFVGFLEDVLAAGFVIELAGGGIEGDAHLLAGLVTGRGDGFENDLDGLFVGFATGSKAAFVADRGGVAVLLQSGFESVKNFHAPAQTFGKAGRTNGHHHKFLKVHGTIRVGAAVQDVHHRAGEKIRGSVGRIAREVFVERELARGSRGTSGSHGDGENGVGAEARLRGRAIELDHALIETTLVGSVEVNDGLGDFRVDVGDGFQNAFAEIFRLVTVAKLERFVFTSGSAGRNRGTAEDAAFENDVRFHGGIPAGVKDLAGIDFADLRGHWCGHGVACLLDER